MATKANWNYPTSVRFGAGRIAELPDALKAAGLTGVSGLAAHGFERTAGVPVVPDPLAVLTAGAVAAGDLQRHAESFFQANRFLLPALVGAVTAAVPADGAVLERRG